MNTTTRRLLYLVLRISTRLNIGRRLLNGLLVQTAVKTTRERPHPWSTAHDYISWQSLTDKSFSARHLPAWDQERELPEPADVMELFRRPEGTPQRLSDKSTLLFPAFAQYLTDGFIRSRMPHAGDDPEVRLQNTSNHNIDLCTLYGRVPEHTHALRQHSTATGQKGRLKSQILNGEEHSPFLFDADLQVVPEFEVLDPPLGLSGVTDPEQKRALFAVGGDRVNTAPQVVMMNTLLLREHNRLAGEIERSNPSWDDDRVFETTRNCLIFMFIKIVVEDYINHISPAPFDLIADPSIAWDKPWNKPNWITTEFSLLYRWHSLIPEQVSWNGTQLPVHTTFMNNRVLIDAGLKQAFVEISAQPAGQLGARNTTDALIPIERSALEQGRLARLAPYVEYKRYVNSPVPKTFEDVSSNPEVVQILKGLYDRVGDIDFYAGLFAEDLEEDSPLPDLILKLVAVDAFSQALTNPLLSKHVVANHNDAFSPVGWAAIEATSTLRSLVERNTEGALGPARIAMTQAGWKSG